MNIVVVSGSPRKKDGINVVKAIERQLSKRDGHTMAYIHLANEQIKSCIGCMQCFERGEGYCPLMKDDVPKIVSKLKMADGIILLTPVYALHVTGTMKSFVDRISYMFHRPELIGKPILGIVTTGGGGQGPTLKYLKMVASCLGGEWVGGIDVISPLYFKENIYYDAAYAEKKRAQMNKRVNRLVDTMQQKSLPRPSFYQLMMFQGLKSKTYIMEADYKFWSARGWIDADYYYEGQLGPIKRVFSRTMAWYIKKMANRMFGINTFMNES